MPRREKRKNNPDVPGYSAEKRALVERALADFLPKAVGPSAPLHEAMRYAVLGSGKRVRPVLALAACEAVGGRDADVLPAACAIELIHSYSLVHDDLPCMDDDDLRRGEPTCHKKFGEDTALLAGDALLTLAFGILASPASRGRGADKKRLSVIGSLAEAAGARGMVGGQAVDLAFQGRDPDLPTLEYIHARKSGALIAASVEAGAVLGGGSPRQIESLRGFGRSAGLLF
ncbi:MAG TPA: polyprenyl synthetase family protein, partial [Candidatus Eisenbacteria bacterium]|nr:polyprenyl synthetase family protein [Candidatus Eisenbacteria bacterium]